jgi:hypothetical protein
MLCVGCAKTLQGKTRANPGVNEEMGAGKKSESSKNFKYEKNEKNEKNLKIEKTGSFLGKFISDARTRNRLFTEADLNI